MGTFKTEKPKSAIQTACRGLGISSDISIYISSLIPTSRGKDRSITHTYYGDLEEGIPPVMEFKNQIDKYEGLLETALGIEGLISGRSVHSCGVCASNNLLQHTAIMKSPNGELITQYDLGDAEQSGLIKYDFLMTKGCAMLQLTLEMLVEYGHVEWQGNLRETYNKYVHPDVINLEDKRLYKKLNEGGLLKAFQYETSMGVKAIRTIHPESLLEVAVANSLMRLSCDGEQPMDRYARYKTDPEAWDNDMKAYGLTDEERLTMHDLLDAEGGVCSSQELMMKMTMDKRIAGFDTILANKLRKGCAKKVKDLIDYSKDKLFELGTKLGTSEQLLHYVWDEQIGMQLGYGFSLLHTIGLTDSPFVVNL